MTIDWCPIDEIQALQTAIDKHWRKNHILARDAELLRWQYRCRKSNEHLSILCATEGDEVIGMLGLIDVEFNLRERVVPGYWLATWFVVPGAPRTLGLALLGEAQRADGEVIACLGFNDTAERIYRGLHFHVTDAVPRWVCVTDSAALERLLNRAGIDREQVINILHTFKHENAKERRNLDCVIVPYDDTMVAPWNLAWDKHFAPLAYATRRDAAYLQWRYLSHPRFDYRVVFAKSRVDGSLHGCAVYRIEKVADCDECVVRIVELLADDWAAPSLASAILAESRTSGAAFADFFCTSSMAARLRQSGFVLDEELPNSLPMLFQPLDISRSRVRAAILPSEREADQAWPDSELLYVTRSDGDQDRPN